jgi:hypothetical protein
MEIIRNKKILGIVGVFVVLAILGGVFLLKSNNAQEAPSDDILSGSDLPTLSPEDIGMEVTVRQDKKALMFELTKADDIKRVEYTIEYEKEIEGETVPEGIFGEMNIADDGITKTDYREFGTCSAGRCRYDDVVSDIKIVLKVTKKDGKDYQVEKIVQL